MIIRELAARLGLEVDQAAFRAADQLLTGIRNGLFALVGAAGAATVALVGIAKGTATAGFEVERSAKQIGVTTDELQRLEYAARRSGISGEDLNLVLKRMARSAYEAAVLGGQAAGAFYRVGVQVRDQTGHVRPARELLNELADAFARLPDGIQKSALAQEIFGRRGQIIIPFLDKGSKGLAELTGAAGRYGSILSEDAIAKSVLFRQALFNLQDALLGVRNAVGVRLLPVLAGLAQRLAEWLAVHRELVAAGAEKLFFLIAEGVTAVAKVVKFLYERWQTLTPAMKGGLIAIASLTTALIAPWAALLVAVGLVADDLVGYFTGENSLIGLVLKKLAELQTQMGAGGILGWLLGSGGPLDRTIDVLLAPVYAALDRLWDWVKDHLAQLPKLLWENLANSLTHPQDLPFLPPGISNLVRSAARHVLPDITPLQQDAPGIFARSDGPYRPKGIVGTPVVFNITQAAGEDGTALAKRILRMYEDARDADLRRLDAQMNERGGR